MPTLHKRQSGLLLAFCDTGRGISVGLRLDQVGLPLTTMGNPATMNTTPSAF